MKNIIAVAVIGLTALPGLAVTVGQIETFEDGTTGGWTAGIGPVQASPPIPPANVATGGPAGTDDNYLRITSFGGQGPGSRLTALNLTEWAGDFSAIDRITMDVRNFGTSDISLRLLFEDPQAGPPQNTAFSAQPIVVTAGGEWTRVAFAIRPSDLLAGAGTVENALGNTRVLRIYHSPTAAFPGEPSVAQLGIDNIRAVVPDGGSMSVLLALGSLTLAAIRRKRS